MSAESEHLQGSLFGNIQAAPNKQETLQKFPDEDNEDFSDTQLAQYSAIKPRTRKKDSRLAHEEDINRSITKEQDSINTTHSYTHHTQIDINQVTPILRHYIELKIRNPERILLYRLGDFFECFIEDAILLSQVLELTLTGKDAGKKVGRIPMAGIPHHAAEKYCSLLIQKGYSIALCDQLESVHNKEGKTIKRGITRILTPGTVIEEGLLEAKKNNWLVAISIEDTIENKDCKWGLANADISTGEFIVKEGFGTQNLGQELLKIEASEVICEQSNENITHDWCPQNVIITYSEKTPFNLVEAESKVKKYFQLQTLQGLGLDEWKMALKAAGGLLSYLEETNPLNVKEGKKNSRIILDLPQISFNQESLIIDSQTKRNLEIIATQKDGQFQGSLLWAIDRTLTAMGGRCLRRWIENPLIKKEKILARQNAVSLLVKEQSIRNTIRKLLKSMGDLERLSGRASAGQAGSRDLIAIANGIERLPLLAENLKILPDTCPSWLKDLQTIDSKLIGLSKTIKSQLIENPPLSLTDGGLIHDGVDPLLDGIRNKLDDQSAWLKNQESIEKKESKIQNLKIQYHRTFGYFFSVTKSKASNVPVHWIRRQTLSNEERFVTPDLKAREGRIFQLQARSSQREYELFCNLREKVSQNATKIRKVARSIAGLDALASLAEIASQYNYCCPSILDNKSTSRHLNIQGCRHPVVEQMLVEKVFEPNSIDLGVDTDLIILTGPNASGKSCYLRQIGLLQLLSQVGSWIPAKSASISIADRVFTRVGAVDDLASGQSTFMVEMSETAYILNQATDKSLVLLDEIGRGTSTFDGLSIAWSVSEYLASEIKSRTIFATHYHELNGLSEKIKNIANFQVLVEETENDIFFLHKVIPGGANRSYGIEAARLAGIPQKVIGNAKKILSNLEKNN